MARHMLNKEQCEVIHGVGITSIRVNRKEKKKASNQSTSICRYANLNHCSQEAVSNLTYLYYMYVLE